MLSTGELMIYLIVYGVFFFASFFLAIIPSKIAKKKGYSGVGFYFFGLFAFVPAIIVASVLRNKNAAAQPPQYQQPYPQYHQYPQQPPQYPQQPQQPQYPPQQQPPQYPPQG